MCAANQYIHMSNQKVVALIDDFFGKLKLIQIKGHVSPQITLKQDLEVKRER